MKKLLITISFVLGFISMVSADIGVNVGVSGNLAVFHATATERTDETLMNTVGTNVDTEKEDATGVAGYTSIFVEKTLSFLPGPFGRMAVGYDMIQGTLKSDKTTKKRSENTVGSSAITFIDNVVEVEFENLHTLYATLNITDNLYVKAGRMQVDVTTNEKLATGSAYGNTDLEGDMYGMGYNTSFGPGLFFRVEGTMMDFGSKKLVSSNAENSVTLNELNGASARVSIGKSF